MFYKQITFCSSFYNQVKKHLSSHLCLQEHNFLPPHETVKELMVATMRFTFHHLDL